MLQRREGFSLGFVVSEEILIKTGAEDEVGVVVESVELLDKVVSPLEDVVAKGSLRDMVASRSISDNE